MEVSWRCWLILLLLPFVMGSDEEDIAMHNREFALSMYKELATQTDGNIFFSPFSISMAMAMVYLGARNNTQTEMAEVLKFKNKDQLHESFHVLKNTLTGADDVELGIANKPYARNDFAILQEYLDAVSQYYGGELERLDFLKDPEGSRETINGWVKEQTKNKIEDLLPQNFISPDTVLVLVNAIYFKGMWEVSFNRSKTSKAAFHMSKSNAIEVDMMSMRDKKFAMTWSSELNAKAISLPYQGDTFDMVIVLPDDVDGLSELESKLNLDNLDALLQRLTHKDSIGVLQIPKFKLLQEVNLVDRFESLGIHDLFEDQADLSGINGDGLLKVSDIVHKAYIDVNEEGTEAAAATGVGIVLMSAPMDFIVDHPYLFLIRDKGTNSILFLGRFNEAPSEDGDTIGTLMRQHGSDPSGAVKLIMYLAIIICSLMLSLFQN